MPDRMSLPTFRYHPDPVCSGSIVESEKKCRCCGQARGYIYSAPVYSPENLDNAFCPWCIADGSAHSKFRATFVDAEAFADGIPESAIDEITQRTPGYASWQTDAGLLAVMTRLRSLHPSASWKSASATTNSRARS